MSDQLLKKSCHCQNLGRLRFGIGVCQKLGVKTGRKPEFGAIYARGSLGAAILPRCIWTRDIDDNPTDSLAACRRAFTIRYLVEQFCTGILRRFARAYGPSPLAVNHETSERYVK